MLDMFLSPFFIACYVAVPAVGLAWWLFWRTLRKLNRDFEQAQADFEKARLNKDQAGQDGARKRMEKTVLEHQDASTMGHWWATAINASGLAVGMGLIFVGGAITPEAMDVGVAFVVASIACYVLVERVATQHDSKVAALTQVCAGTGDSGLQAVAQKLGEVVSTLQGLKDLKFDALAEQLQHLGVGTWKFEGTARPGGSTTG